VLSATSGSVVYYISDDEHLTWYCKNFCNYHNIVYSTLWCLSYPFLYQWHGMLRVKICCFQGLKL